MSGRSVCKEPFSDWKTLQLADLANFTQPWSISKQAFPEGVTLAIAFKNNDAEAPIALDVLEREYCRVTHQPYPIPEIVFARSWMLFRVSRWLVYIASNEAEY